MEDIETYCVILNRARSAILNSNATTAFPLPPNECAQFNLISNFKGSHANDHSTKSVALFSVLSAAGFHALTLVMEDTCRKIMSGPNDEDEPLRLMADKLLNKCYYIAYVAGTKTTMPIMVGSTDHFNTTGPSAEDCLVHDSSSRRDNLLAKCERSLGEFLPNPNSKSVLLYDLGYNSAPVRPDLSFVILNEFANNVIKTNMVSNHDNADRHHHSVHKVGSLLSELLPKAINDYTVGPNDPPAGLILQLRGLLVHVVSKGQCIGVLTNLNLKSTTAAVALCDRTLHDFDFDLRDGPAPPFYQWSDLRLVIPRVNDLVLVIGSGVRNGLARGNVVMLNEGGHQITVMISPIPGPTGSDLDGEAAASLNFPLTSVGVVCRPRGGRRASTEPTPVPPSSAVSKLPPTNKEQSVANNGRSLLSLTKVSDNICPCCNTPSTLDTIGCSNLNCPSKTIQSPSVWQCQACGDDNPADSFYQCRGGRCSAPPTFSGTLPYSVGISNDSNLCYMISIFQFLLTSTPLIHRLNDQVRLSTDPRATDSSPIPVTGAILDLAASFKLSISQAVLTETTPSPCRLDGVLVHVPGFWEAYAKGKQEDASEFLTYLMNVLQKESHINSLFETSVVSKAVCLECKT